MRASQLYAPTLKENPNDAEIVSHQLLTRAGFIRKLTAGVYDYLPLARRVLHKIEHIIRQELENAGAQELLMPLVQPAEIWQESGRWQQYGPELLRLRDRKGGDFCLGPTHEEVIVDIIRRDVRSWRQLPLNLFQIQAKFRDEIRPRAGLMRGREFIMKDAYSFDVDEASALSSYDRMFDAYCKIFERCGLEFRPVEADTGAIGGSRSHEFQVLADSGEDSIVSCSSCNYAANVEQAELCSVKLPIVDEASNTAEPTLVETPEVKSIEDVSHFLKRSPADFIKTIAVNADESLVAVLVRGDHELNLIKVKKALGVQNVELASDAQIKATFGTEPGFIGPYQLPLSADIQVLADLSLEGGKGFITGGNQVDTHWINVDIEQCTVTRFIDVRMAQQGDPCPLCNAELKEFRGIEVGHVFYLGTKYTESMKCNILDEQGQERPIVMGCYGIGVSRVMAAAIEQNHDEYGICWPANIAPYQVHILALQPNVTDVTDYCEQLYAQCKDAGIEVLYDDRDIRAGGKFKDADLYGIPIRVAVGGRGLKEGIVELKMRADKVVEKIKIETLFSELSSRVVHSK